jgi:hypothetical protein
MRKPTWIVGILLVGLISIPAIPANSLTLAPQVAQDKDSGYDRTFFKHWIDAELFPRVISLKTRLC